MPQQEEGESSITQALYRSAGRYSGFAPVLSGQSLFPSRKTNRQEDVLVEGEEGQEETVGPDRQRAAEGLGRAITLGARHDHPSEAASQGTPQVLLGRASIPVNSK